MEILVPAVAAGVLPDGTPIIVSGADTVLAGGTPVGKPLTGHDGFVHAVAAGALPDRPPVIVSGGFDRTVRVWRLADGTPLMPPLDLPESVRAVALHGNVIINCGQGGHRRPPASAPTAHALAVVLFPGTRPAGESTG